MKAAETVIIGGGIVGLSVALGLLQAGVAVAVLDGEDSDLRASQGNFGLVWLQGKGAQFAPYARWTSEALNNWPALSNLLQDVAGQAVHLDQTGGYEFFTDPAEIADFTADLRAQKDILGNDLPYEVIAGDDLRKRFPMIGPKVLGATYCPRDGHVNPLLMLRALRLAVQRLGSDLRPNHRVTQIKRAAAGYLLQTPQGTVTAERIVLCAGLGAMQLAPQLGFQTQVHPQRGELLVTEKLATPLPFLSSTIRQVNEGGLQIGGTAENAGLSPADTLAKSAWLARHAVEVLPALEHVRVVRSWGAQRIKTQDGAPVYARSDDGTAHLVTCHSGVTLAAQHVLALPKWIEARAGAPDLEAFDESRFAV